MHNLTITFDEGPVGLDVRRVAIHEHISQTFEAEVYALGPDPDLDFEVLVQKGATLEIQNGRPGPTDGRRRFCGVIASMDLVEIEDGGASLFRARLVPRLWLLTQRVGARVFQHQTAVQIVTSLLDEWKVEHRWQLSDEHPQLEIRTQYQETDYAFVERLLAEAGIAYYFSEDPESNSLLILTDAPQAREPRPPLPFQATPRPEAGLDYATAVRFAQRVRPGKVTLRDHDFRREPEYELLGEAEDGAAGDGTPPLEVFGFDPGGFIVEKGTELLEDQIDKLPSMAKSQIDKLTKGEVDKLADKVEEKVKNAIGSGLGDMLGDAAGKLTEKVGDKLADKISGMISDKVVAPLTAKIKSGLGMAGDDKGAARFNADSGGTRASKQLEQARADRRLVAFATNAIDLAPGVVTSIVDARSELSENLLVVEVTLEATPEDEWSQQVRATFGSAAYRPRSTSDKPRMQGLQSALVVGPEGDSIYTDELGRVRLQFHWDRLGKRDSDSYCWARVAQGWAGPGYGLITLPRIGHEVLVAFLEGDPDQPVVVGRLFNGTSPPPYPLPAHKTRSVWRSSSTPGDGSGFNEIMFEDRAGEELLFVQAERDRIELIKRNHLEHVGNDAKVAVGQDRETEIGANDMAQIGQRYRVSMAQLADSAAQTHFEMVDQRIVLSTGEASITLEGPNITLAAKGMIKIVSSDDSVEIQGGPWVKINCDSEADVEASTYSMKKLEGVARDQDGSPLAGFTLQIEDAEGNVQQITTDAEGRYNAMVVPGGAKVSAPGFKVGAPGAPADALSDEPVDAEPEDPELI